jgi:hypothetical protein
MADLQTRNAFRERMQLEGVVKGIRANSNVFRERMQLACPCTIVESRKISRAAKRGIERNVECLDRRILKGPS